MPRVLHIITRLTLGGAQETVLYYYQHLHREKFEVYLLSGPHQEYQDAKLLERLSGDEHFAWIQTLDNAIHPLRDIRAIRDIYRFLKLHPMDIVHTHSAKAGFVGRVAAWMARVPVIIHTVHGWSFHPQMAAWLKKVYILLEGVLAKLSHRLIAVTTTDIDKGLAHGIGTRSQYVIIRSGIAFSNLEHSPPEAIAQFKKRFMGKRLIGAVGRLSPPKNYPDFIKIAKELCRRRTDLHFVIVGDGELRGELEAMLQQQGMAEHITLLGLRSDVGVILRSLDAVLLTSLWEGLPRVLPEAMYCGVPVVANGVDGVREIIQDGVNGCLLAPGDILGAVAALEKILDIPALAQSLIAAAKEGVQDYAAEKMLADTEALYEACLEAQEGGSGCN